MMASRTTEGSRTARPLRIRDRIFGSPSHVPTVARMPDHGTSGQSSICADFGTLAGGRVALRAASIRGLSHQTGSTPRQDDYAIVADDRSIVVAVADGVGSAAFSHLGSRIAAQTAATLTLGGIPGASIAAAVSAALSAEAHRMGVAVDTMSTTLLVARVELGAADQPWFVRVAEWGDTRASIYRPGVVDEGHPSWSHVCDDPEQSLANSVKALPGHRLPTTYGTAIWMPGQVLLAATDGIDGQLQAQNSVGHGLAEAWATIPGIAQFIADVSFDRAGSRDDRTAVCLFRPPVDPTGWAA